MLFQNQMENQIEAQEQKINALEMQLETLDREMHELLNLLQVSSAQLSAFIEKKENFTDENWEELLKHRKQLDDKMNRELENIRNPRKAKRAYSGLRVERHWLHVR